MDQPTGLGIAPSGMHLDADDFGPDTHSLKSPCTKIAMAEPNCCSSSKPSFETIEGHGIAYVIDNVSYLGHFLASLMPDNY